MQEVEAWYQKYGESVYRRCLRLTHNPDKALDLMQDVFLRAHRYRDSFRGERSALSWLLTIADRCFFDTVRRAEPIPSDEIESFVREEEEGAEVIFERYELVSKLLARCPRDVRQIVIHRYFDELEHAQIALRLDINEKTVRRKLERFLERARKLAALAKR